jgi:hypothetical protein
MKHGSGGLILALTLTACGLVPPSPECDVPRGGDQRALTCEAAVHAAIGVLPDEDTPQVNRIQFLYGSVTPCCSYLYGPGEEAPVDGYVVFTYASGSREYVDVSLWHGELNAGELLPYGDRHQ